MARKTKAQPPADDGIESLADTLPPGDGPPIFIKEAHERQAEAVANTAPPVGGEQSLGGPGHNTIERKRLVEEKLARLKEIKEERAELAKEEGELIKSLEKETGVNRGALAEVRRLDTLSPAAITAREESRRELFEWFVAPKLKEAAEAGSEG